MNYTCESKGMMVGDTAMPAPIETVRNMVSDTMGVIKELLMARIRDEMRMAIR